MLLSKLELSKFMPTLLIIEPHFDGHRGGYVTWIAKAAADRGFIVKIATLSANLSHPLLGPLQELLGAKLEVVVLDKEEAIRSPDNVVSLIFKEFRYWALLRRLYAQSACPANSVTIFVPYLDYCTNAIALLGSPFGVTPWSGIVMRQAFHFRVAGVKGNETSLRWVKHKLFKRLLRSQHLRSLFTLDESLVKVVSVSKQKGAEKIVYLPDPAQHQKSLDREYARSSLGIRRGAAVILVYGGIRERKGVSELLTALGTLRGNQEVDVIIAGRQSKGVRKSIDSPEFAPLVAGGQLHQIDRFLNVEEELLVFSAADIVWLGYRDFYMMSGVLVQAGQMSLPVIATSDGLIGRLTKTHGLGLVVDVRDSCEVRKAIELLTASSALRTELGKNGKKIFSAHTVCNFVDTIFRSL